MSQSKNRDEVIGYFFEYGRWWPLFKSDKQRLEIVHIKSALGENGNNEALEKYLAIKGRGRV